MESVQHTDNITQAEYKQEILRTIAQLPNGEAERRLLRRVYKILLLFIGAQHGICDKKVKA